MNKQERLKLIRQAYQNVDKKRRNLVPELSGDLDQEARLEEKGAVLDAGQDDIREEIGLMGDFRRPTESWDFDIESLFD
jgi:hypothetical protein